MRVIYLDNAATSFPKPPSVYKEIWWCMNGYAANPGRGAHRMSILAAEKVYEAREELAKLFKIENPSRIFFYKNATEALNTGIKGVLRPGDEIIISPMEHNSVYRPAKRLEAKGVKVVISNHIADGIISLQNIKEKITPNTRLVCITHVSNVTGGINPVREIGRYLNNTGILFMVDAAQSAGSIPIDVKNDCIDILAFPGHKGLLGPMGTGGLYVREGIDIYPLLEGGTGGNSETPYLPDIYPERMESGTVNLPGLAGLCEGTKYVLKLGCEQIGYYEKRLAQKLAEGLSTIKGIKILGPQNPILRSNVVSITSEKADGATMAERLDREFYIATRSGLHCAPLAARTLGIEESLRFSVGPFNTEKDISEALFAMKKITE